MKLSNDETNRYVTFERGKTEGLDPMQTSTGNSQRRAHELVVQYQTISAAGIHTRNTLNTLYLGKYVIFHIHICM